MKQIGPITIPFDRVVQVDSYEKILNFIFDCQLDNATDALNTLHKDKHPKVLILTNKDREVYAALTYMPPEEWKTTEGQEMILWVAPTLTYLYTYFSQWHYKVRVSTEKMALMMILQYIEILMKQQLKKSPLHEG